MLKLIILFFLISTTFGQEIVPVRIHYSGGGDWYGNKTSWTNILSKAKRELNLKVSNQEKALKILDPEFFKHSFCYIAGHGNISFSDEEANVLREYLISGGFLYADDDYGMDKSFRKQMKKIFPELNFVELPFSHPIYHSVYNFNNGLPKIHEHDGGAPKGLGLIYDDRLVCFYSFNTDISDGCEDGEIHNDPPEKRDSALRMALNILIYAFMN